MSDTLVHLEIVTPKKVFLSDDVKSITAPGIEGLFQILPKHAPFVTTIVPGKVKVTTKEGAELIYATSGGTLEVNSNKIIFLAETIESKEEIDLKRAEAAKQKAEQIITAKEPGTNFDEARAALNRAVARIKVATA